MPKLAAMLSLLFAPIIAFGGIVPLIGEPPSMPGIGEVEVTFDRWGLGSLKYNNTEFLQSGWSHVDDVKFKDASGVETTGDTSSDTTVDAKTGVVSQTYSWGNASYTFQPAAARLEIVVAIRNDSAQTLSSFMLALPTLKFPATPSEYDGNTPMLGHNVGAPTAVTMSYGTGTLVLTNEDATQPLMAGFPWAYDRPTSTVFPIAVNTGRNWSYPSSLPFIDRPIAPGATLNFTLSLRFGPAGATAATLAGDVFEKFRTAFPFRISWPDRRSIGSLFLATSAAGWPKNPRGWFNDSSLDVTTPEGVAAFKNQLLAYADRSVAILKAMNSQGMITWDIEGEQFPHATTYIGDPRLAETLAPEANGVLDAYFKKFRDAGLRVGVTIRPQQLALAADSAQQNEVADPAQQLMDKIAFAKERWGATLFYIDSNGDPNCPTDAAFIERVAAYPDVLLIPESQNLRYYATTAPYDELRRGTAATPQNVLSTYPTAFSVINIADADVAASRAELTSAVQRGDILLYHAWFDDSANALVKQIYADALP